MLLKHGTIHFCLNNVLLLWTRFSQSRAPPPTQPNPGWDELVAEGLLKPTPSTPPLPHLPPETPQPEAPHYLPLPPSKAESLSPPQSVPTTAPGHLRDAAHDVPDLRGHGPHLPVHHLAALGLRTARGQAVPASHLQGQGDGWGGRCLGGGGVKVGQVGEVLGGGQVGGVQGMEEVEGMGE